ncbi:MAG: thiamine pyrophosphate-requiring protein [Chloroflexi bacterium]|nr:thiamine pyrophosphate-requiring protein [Chloroflexota bacterium]
MKGCDVIAEILKREGTEVIFAYPYQPLIEAAAKVGIRPILCRQERVGISMADGYSRATSGKKLGIFTMQQGPGTENAFPGAAQANSDNIPVLLLPGGESREKRYIKPNFQATEHYGGVTKWMASVTSSDRISSLMRRAFYQLRTGRGAPVLIETPRDILEFEEIAKMPEYTPVLGSRFGPDAQDVRNVAELLLKSKNLVIHAGQGINFAEAWDELREFAELLQAPVMTTMPGKGALPENHPLALGSSAVSTTKPISHFLKKSDTIFAIGSSLTRTNYGKTLPDGKTIIHSTNEPADVNKDYTAQHAIIGDSKLVLQALIAELRGAQSLKKKSKGEVAEEVQTVKKEWLNEWASQLNSDEVPINQYRVIRDVMSVVDRDNTIVTHDAGSPRDQVIPFWETTAPMTYLGWGKSTQLGHGLGLTMGAKVANPDKVCINFMGDAAIGMTGMDLETAARCKIGIVTIVFNNGAMAIERKSMPTATEKYGTVFQTGDYAGVSKALGGWSKRVEKPADIIPTMKKAIEAANSGQPALVEVITKEGFDFSKYP